MNKSHARRTHPSPRLSAPARSRSAEPAAGSRRTPPGNAPEWALGEPFEFLRLLWAVAHALDSTSKQMQSTLGITGPQRLVLKMVGRFPEITAGQLAQLLHVHPSTLTGIVQRLGRRGLLQRRSDVRDKRRTLLGLTPAGKRLDVTDAGSVENTVAKTLVRLPSQDVAATRKTLARLGEALGRGARGELDEGRNGRASDGGRARSSGRGPQRRPRPRGRAHASL